MQSITNIVAWKNESQSTNIIINSLINSVLQQLSFYS